MKKQTTNPVTEGRATTPLQAELEQRFVEDPIYRELAAELDFRLREDEPMPSRDEVQG